MRAQHFQRSRVPRLKFPSPLRLPAAHGALPKLHRVLDRAFFAFALAALKKIDTSEPRRLDVFRKVPRLLRLGLRPATQRFERPLDMPRRVQAHIVIDDLAAGRDDVRDAVRVVRNERSAAGWVCRIVTRCGLQK